MAKPSVYPEWATDLINEIRTINGSQKVLPNRVEPFEEWKATGELSRQPIPREYLNWQLWNIGEWIKHLDERSFVGEFKHVTTNITASDLAEKFGGSWTHKGSYNVTTSTGTVTMKLFERTA